MVKFGKRLADLRKGGWEAHYIRYDALKEVVQAIIDAETPEEQARISKDVFVVQLTQQLTEVVNVFFIERLALLARRETDLADPTLRAGLDDLRDFVAVNIIATTKIVKKHDKHVGDALELKNDLGTVVVGLDLYHNEVFRGIQARVPEKKQPVGAGPGATKIDMDSETKRDTNTSEFWVDQVFEDYFPGKGYGDGSKEKYASLLRWEDEVDIVAGKDAQEDEGNPWVVDFRDDSLKAWKDMDTLERVKLVALLVLKLICIFGLLYLFICSLAFLADAFRLLAGKSAGAIFRDNVILNNPIGGLMIGVLATVLVQSSSTSTSIVITMVAASLLTVRQAIPIIMGANIGTSVTSTIVALGQVNDRNEFRRAFAAATVHDMFNFMTVGILLPIEAATGYLFLLSNASVSSYGLDESFEKGEKIEILKVVTSPFTKMIMQLDKGLITKIAKEKNATILAELQAQPIMKSGKEYLFNNTGLEDWAMGLVMLVLALTILCVCLYLIVKLLKSLLKGHIAVVLHKVVNGNVPDIVCCRANKHEGRRGCKFPMGWLAGYISMAVGMCMTILVQSSSITTSALTPLVGLGVVTLERVYPVVLGANIGTTCTGLLAALASDPDKISDSLQVAYAHLFFNISGIILFYLIWPMRALPIAAAKFLGDVTAKYRWYPLAYLFIMFGFVPAFFLLLSLTGTVLIVVVYTTLVIGLLGIMVMNMLMTKVPQHLPKKLRDWTFLPVGCRSLEPYDRLICARLTCCTGAKCGSKAAPAGDDGDDGRRRPNAVVVPDSAEIAVAEARLEGVKVELE